MQADRSSGWVLVATDRAAYAPPALANGMIGLVPSARELSFDQVILNGVYDRYGRGDVSNIVQGILFADLDLCVGGKHLGDRGQVSGWRQELDMQHGCLTTHLVFDSVQVEHTVYALRHLPYTALVTLELTAMEDVRLVVTNRHSLPDILRPVRHALHVYEEIPLLFTVADSPTGRHRIAVASTFLCNGQPLTVGHQDTSERTHCAHLELNMTQGRTYRLGLVGSICSTANFADPASEAERLTVFARFEGRDRLISNHRRAWSDLWQGDIQIGGDEQAQRDARFALYNLYSFVREGSGCSLSPMGLSSTGYNGHVFWDCELWMLPPLLMLRPELARSALDYRFRRLDPAIRNAISHGYRGAMFPWESDDTGQEATPTWAFTGPFEHHITACVGIAFWNYFCVTHDRMWLAEKGYPVLQQASDFWVSRVERNALGMYEIRRVIGADEYTGVVDNNAFTNGAAMTMLRHAAQAAQTLGMTPDTRWLEVAERIVLPQFDDGVTREYDGYDGRIIKQADVNLLAYPLNVLVDENTIRRDLAFYEPRLDTDAPAMSHSVLSVIYARLGDVDKAYLLFERAYKPNQKPPFGVLTETPFSHNPYFGTAAGGMLQAVLAGFAGLHITPDGIVQRNPCLPAAWTSLTVTGVGPDRRTYTVS